jgi:hypothetical protein
MGVALTPHCGVSTSACRPKGRRYIDDPQSAIDHRQSTIVNYKGG